MKKEEAPSMLLVPGMLVTSTPWLVIVLAATDERVYMLGDRWVRWLETYAQR